MKYLITILSLALIACNQGLSAYETGCAAGIATRDQPIEVWEPNDDSNANPEFIRGYYDCR